MMDGSWNLKPNRHLRIHGKIDLGDLMIPTPHLPTVPFSDRDSEILIKSFKEIIMPKTARLFTLLLVLSLTAIVHADDVIIGKVVGVADGDTITVLENRTQYKIRLYGIDTPESHQDFGNRPNNLPPIWCSGKRSRSLKRILIAMVVLSGWSMWGIYASMKRWLKVVWPGYIGNIVRWKSAGAGWIWSQWPWMVISVFGPIQIQCRRGSIVK
jgi:hypothetical protein